MKVDAGIPTNLNQVAAQGIEVHAGVAGRRVVERRQQRRKIGVPLRLSRLGRRNHRCGFNQLEVERKSIPPLGRGRGAQGLAQFEEHSGRHQDHGRQQGRAGDAERALLWKGRKGAFPAMGRISTRRSSQRT